MANAKAAAAVPDRIVRENECRQLSGLSRTRRYELERLGRFPKRVKLSERATGWRLSDINSWVESRASSAQ
jgi:prophage regulatory protein